jgi:hypothetical protein
MNGGAFYTPKIDVSGTHDLEICVTFWTLVGMQKCFADQRHILRVPKGSVDGMI